MSVGMGFAAGALFGAIAVFVPFVSAGHPRPAAERVDTRSSAAKAAAPHTRRAGSEKPDIAKTPDPSRDATCDVQLD